MKETSSEFKSGTTYDVVTPIKPTSLPIAEVRPSWSPEISLNAKAWNGRVICSWLAETMCDAVEGPGYDAGNDPGRLAVLTSFALTLGLP